jgi:hypothetical protein
MLAVRLNTSSLAANVYNRNSYNWTGPKLGCKFSLSGYNGIACAFRLLKFF